jgi:hypothetical protein
LQLGFKGGSRWAITLDLTASWSALGEITLPNNRDYSMTRISIVAGCKIGFFDR